MLITHSNALYSKYADTAFPQKLTNTNQYWVAIQYLQNNRGPYRLPWDSDPRMTPMRGNCSCCHHSQNNRKAYISCRFRCNANVDASHCNHRLVWEASNSLSCTGQVRANELYV